MTDAEVQEFVTRFAAAWAARDGNAFLELWHPEGLLDTPLVNRRGQGQRTRPPDGSADSRRRRISSGNCWTGPRAATS